MNYGCPYLIMDIHNYRGFIICFWLPYKRPKQHVCCRCMSIFQMELSARTFWSKEYSSHFLKDLKTRWVDGTPTSEVTRYLSGRSLHLTLVTKWSHMTLKIQISKSWPRSNPLSHLRSRVQSMCLLLVSWQSNHIYIANSIFDLENSRSRSRPKSTKI